MREVTPAEHVQAMNRCELYSSKICMMLLQNFLVEAILEV